MKPLDLTGQRFGILTAKGAERKGRNKAWRCVCDCGGEVIATTGDLRYGKYVSCGCLRKVRAKEVGDANVKHGGCRREVQSPTWKVWRGMRRRCDDPTNKYYGGRGITYDPAWSEYENFLADMGPKPKGMTIERIDNNAGYSKGNCKWATPSEQALNRKKKAA